MTPLKKIKIIDVSKAYREVSPSEAGLWQTGPDMWTGLAESIDYYMETAPKGVAEVIS